MGSHRENTESSFEQLEGQVEIVSEKKEELEQRATLINQAIMQLEKDAELAKSVERFEQQLEVEKQNLETQRYDALSSLDAIRHELDEIESQTELSDASLDTLRLLGEDITESKSILSNRQRWLEECYRRVERLAALLGEDYEAIGDFLPTSQRIEQEGAQKLETDEVSHNASETSKDLWDSPSQDSTQQEALQALHQYMVSHNYEKKDFAIFSMDPEWRKLMIAAHPDYQLPPLSQEEARYQLNQYTNSNNYGPDDASIYSKDPKWRRLVHAAYPDYKLPPLDRETAKTMLRDYMYLHNFGQDDASIYMKDPEWQFLEFSAYPENLTPVKIWAKSINPNYKNPLISPDKQRDYETNCGSCALALEQHFLGEDLLVTASSKNIPYDQDMEKATGKKCIYMEPREIEQILYRRGPGSHLIVGINRENPITKRPAAGHWFNVYYDGKNIHTVDGQTGKIYEWPHDYHNISAWCALV